MSKESIIKTIKKSIYEEELLLADMHKKVKLLNTAIPKLENEIEAEKARLKKLEGK